MKNFNFFIKIFIFICYVSVAQSSHEFYGVIKLNGNDKSIISYRLVFTEDKGKIIGYSVTDLDGPHETKNEIQGSYDSKTKMFTFQERDILYTKSKFDESSFCFVNFSGKVKLVEKTSKLEGNFKGLFKNKTKCIDGTITLIGSSKIYDIFSKINKKIQKKKNLDNDIKEKYNPIKLLDSLKINKLTKDQNLNVFWESNKVDFLIWDNGQEDGDKINLFQNGKLILGDYQVTSIKKKLTVTLLGKNDVFKIVALNEGKIKTNTVKIELQDQTRTFELMANLNKDEFTLITVLKK